MTVRGRIIEVTAYTVGTNLENDYSAGATVLEVTSGAEFADAGGQCIINGDTYTYVSITPGVLTDTMTLAPGGLLTGLLEGEPVYVSPLSERKIAVVSTLDSSVGDPNESIEAVVGHAIKLTLEEGRRPEGQGEQVVIEKIDGVDTIVEVKDRRPTVPSTAIDGLDIPTAPPSDAPVVTVTPSGVAGIQIEWDPVPLAEKYEIHLSLTSPVEEDGSDKVAETTNEVFRVYDEIAGITIPMGSTVYVKVRAINQIDAGPYSLEGNATTRSADGFITALFVAAIRAEFNDLIAGTIEAALANVTGTLNIGPRMQFDGENSTFTTWSDNEHTQIVAQISPFDAIFRGRVETDFLNTMRGVVLTGIDSQIASGGMLYLMSGIGDPGSPPNVVNQPLNMTWPVATAGMLERGICWDATASKFYRLMVPDSGDISTNCIVQRISAAGVAETAIGLANVPSVSEIDMNGIELISGSFYIAVKDTSGEWCAARFDASSGAYQDRNSRKPVLGRPCVGKNSAGTRALWANLETSGGVDSLIVEELSLDLQTSYGFYDRTGTSNKLEWQPGWANNLSFIQTGTFDYGASKLVVFAGTSGRVYNNTSGTIYDYNAQLYFFSPQAVTVGGATWIPGGSFFTSYGTINASMYSSYHPDPSKPNAYVTFNLTDGASVTLDSPAAQITHKNRKFLLVTLPGLPDGTTGWDVYVGEGATLPVDAQMWERLETISGNSMMIDLANAPGSGHPPVSNTFGAVTPAEIRSQSGLSFWRGDDSVAFPELEAIYDTDWINLTYAAGWGVSTPGQLAYRRYGRVVQIRGGASGTVTNTLQQVTDASSPLPPDCRPETGTKVRAVETATGLRVGQMEITDAGHIFVAAANGVTGATWVACDATFIVG